MSVVVSGQASLATEAEGTALEDNSGRSRAASPVADLDAWLSQDGVFREPPARSRSQLVEALRDSLRHHVKTNPSYARYAEIRGFDPETLTFDTLDRIPLLPSALFKEAPDSVRSVTTEDVVMTTSSGTQGSVSRVPRDNTTIMRFFASVAAAVRDLLDIEDSETVVHNLGPRVEESKHLWISYVMAGVAVIHETDFWVSDGVPDIEGFASAVRDAPVDRPMLIVGPPPLISDIAAQLLDDVPLPLSPLRTVITIGGWKKRSGELVDQRSFEATVRQAFGLERADAIRDAYNMVELNTVVLECSARRKHCPPWLYASARDAKSLASVLPGTTGILAFADPTAASFPGMILSDDFGWVDRDVNCECGVIGDTIRIERRINRLESRGCAMKI